MLRDGEMSGVEMHDVKVTKKINKKIENKKRFKK